MAIFGTTRKPLSPTGRTMLSLVIDVTGVALGSYRIEGVRNNAPESLFMGSDKMEITGNLSEYVLNGEPKPGKGYVSITFNSGLPTPSLSDLGAFGGFTFPQQSSNSTSIYMYLLIGSRLKELREELKSQKPACIVVDAMSAEVGDIDDEKPGETFHIYGVHFHQYRANRLDETGKKIW